MYLRGQNILITNSTARGITNLSFWKKLFLLGCTKWPASLRKKFKNFEKGTFLLKENAVFDTFFAKVRYLPYNAKKCVKNSIFFKQKRPIFDPVN